MKLKTSELTGPALDWAVAKCEGIAVIYESRFSDGAMKLYIADADEKHRTPDYFEPSTKWSQGGPVIEREGMTITQFNDYPNWDCNMHATDFNRNAHGTGSTPLIAAMRCYVASKLGDEVEIPEELK